MTNRTNVASVSDNARLLPSADLWQATHNALCEGAWSRAVSLLDALGQRSDFSDQLLSLDAYTSAARAAGASDLSDRRAQGVRTQLADRIDMVNWRVDHRAEGY